MEYKLKEVISREPTLLVMVVGVPNVGKSALINSIHQIASSRFPGEFIMLMLGAAFMKLILLEKKKRERETTAYNMDGIHQCISRNESSRLS